MSNLLAKGQALLTRLMAKDASPAGRVLYYRVDGGQPIDLTGKCWVGNSPSTRLPHESGPAIVHRERDYLIPAADLEYEPKRGDRIIEKIGTCDKVFEVMSEPGEPEWRWSDPGQTVRRVHTKPQEC